MVTGIFTSGRGRRLLGESATVVVDPDMAIEDAPDRGNADLFVLRRKRGIGVGSSSVGS